MQRLFADPTRPENAPRVLAFLSEALGRRDLSLRGMPGVLPGGAQNRSYSCSVVAGGEVLDCVIRCEPASIPPWRQGWGFYDLEREFGILREIGAFNFGVATPRVHGLSDALGVPGFLMERLPGTPMEHAYTPSDRAIVPAYARLVAATSTVSVPADSWLRRNLVEWTMETQLAWTEEKSRHAAGEPLRDYCLAWLREHRPAIQPLLMAHNDPNPGNWLTEDGRITGLVDWEFARLTDDPINGLLRITWLYQSEDLVRVFCEALERDPGDFNWHLVTELFRSLYITGGPNRARYESGLAALVGFTSTASRP